MKWDVAPYISLFPDRKSREVRTVIARHGSVNSSVSIIGHICLKNLQLLPRGLKKVKCREADISSVSTYSTHMPLFAATLYNNDTVNYRRFLCKRDSTLRMCNRT